MNSIIRLLADKALDNVVSYTWTNLDYSEINKLQECFAQLVVKETIDELLTQMWIHGIDESNNPSIYKAVEKTKRHFGVPE